MKAIYVRMAQFFSTIANATFLMCWCFILPYLTSCCNRPYVAGRETWPLDNRYPSGPYEYVAKVYCIQSGFCPKAGDLGSNVTVSIWNFGEETRLFSDSFSSDRYFEDFIPTWTKDGSLLVLDEKTGETIKKYPRIGQRKWTRNAVNQH